MIKVEDKNTGLEKELIRIRKYDIIYSSCDKCGKSFHKQYRKNKNRSIDRYVNFCTKCKTENTNLKRYGVTNTAKAEIVKERTKKTNLKRYGVTNTAKAEIVKERTKKTNLKKYGVICTLQDPGVKKKIRKTLLYKYGCENPLQNEQILKKVRETNIKKYGVTCTLHNPKIAKKSKTTWIKKYGVDHPLKSKEVKNKFKKTCLIKYGVDNPAKDSEVMKKMINSKRRNHSFNTSKSEERIYDYLVDKYPDILRQYNIDSRYPFLCDFYIPSKDLFIECNFSWLHGTKPYHEPFDENKVGHIEKLNEWMKLSINKSFYKSAIETWTVRDLIKRKTAKKNNINFVEFFYEEDVYNFFKDNCI